MKSFARLVFRLRERVLLRWRYALMWSVLGRVGRKVRFYGLPIMDYPERIRIGDRCTVNHGVVLGGRGSLEIGRNVRISSYAVIETGYLLPDMRRKEHGGKPIVIEDDVWIATGAKVLAGVTIGRGSVIAAGAVITKDVPPNCLAKGIPARFSPLEAASP